MRWNLVEEDLSWLLWLLSSHLHIEILCFSQVRLRFQKLPGGPDESQSIQDLEERILHHDKQMQLLSSKLALRPKPSQYEALKQEVTRFLENAGNVDRVKALVEKLKVGFFEQQNSKLF